MPDLRLYDKDGNLRESLEAAQKRILRDEGAELSLSQVARRLIHIGQRSLDQSTKRTGTA